MNWVLEKHWVITSPITTKQRELLRILGKSVGCKESESIELFINEPGKLLGYNAVYKQLVFQGHPSTADRCVTYDEVLQALETIIREQAKLIDYGVE